MYKILMIDDDQFLLFQYAEILRENGFCVKSTTNIETFYSEAISDNYDAIICDINLPTNNFINEIEAMGGWRTGLALCKKIRLHGSDSKLIALTNSSLPEAVEWFSQDESVAYCNKRLYPPLEFANVLKFILNNPDIVFGELEDTYTLQYQLLTFRKHIPNCYNEINQKLDIIINALISEDNKTFKSSIKDFISISANISSIISSIPIIKDLVTFLQTLI